MSKENKSINLYDEHKHKFINPKIMISVIVLFLIVLLFIIWAVDKRNKENQKNLVGYTLQHEQLVDTCNLVNVDGFYLGKGTLDGELHYIFQVEKNNEKSNNIDVPDKQIDIYYVTSSDTTDKPGTVKAYTRDYVKKDKNAKIVKTAQRYYYKVYITQNSIKDCGTLTSSSDDE